MNPSPSDYRRVSSPLPTMTLGNCIDRAAGGLHEAARTGRVATEYPSSSIQAHRNFLRKCKSPVRPGATESQTGDNRLILGSQSHAFARQPSAHGPPCLPALSMSLCVVLLASLPPCYARSYAEDCLSTWPPPSVESPPLNDAGLSTVILGSVVCPYKSPETLLSKGCPPRSPSRYLSPQPQRRHDRPGGAPSAASCFRLTCGGVSWLSHANDAILENSHPSRSMPSSGRPG